MAKETKIGLSVVAVLTCVLAGVAVKRFVLTGPAGPVAPATAASEPAPLPAAEKPTVVMAQKGALPLDGVPTADDHADHGSDVPHGSFLPADPASEQAPARLADRYATEPEPQTAAEEQAPATAKPNPFGQRMAARGKAAPQEAPQELGSAPEDAAALEARRAAPRAARTNPLRRLSAEEPIDGEQAGEMEAPADLSFGNDQPAAEEPLADTAAEAPTTDAPLADDSLAPQGAQPFDESLDPPAAEPAAEAEPEPAAAPPRSRYQAVEPSAPPAPVAALPANGRYTIQPNDNLWKVSEKVYGNGRYFKAIYEHNKIKLPDPDRLVAGTEIAVPPPGILEDRYPALCPKQRKSVLVKPREVPASAQAPVAGSRGADVYVVAEGDTLFDIARYELGKAARWGEIYELNRDLLGEDFDYLQPGLELKMPARDAASSTARKSGSRYGR